MRPVIAPVLGAVALTAPARPVGDEVPVDPKADDHAPALALVGIALVALSPRGLVDQQAVDAAAQLGAARHDVDDALAVVGFPAKIGRAHVCTPVTNAHLVCRLLLEKKKTDNMQQDTHR